jgi:hypothetical protein
MTLQIHARLRDGILIPTTPINLPDQDDLVVTIAPADAAKPTGRMRDDPQDPCPEDGPALLAWFGRHRINLDPDILRDIIESDEYLDQEPDDEP